MVFIKVFLTGVLYENFKLVYMHLKEEDIVRKCYSCLLKQANFYVCFFTIVFVKPASLKEFY